MAPPTTPLTVTLASTSPLKRAAVAKFFDIPVDNVQCVSCECLNLPPQPCDSGEACAMSRYCHVETMNPDTDYLVAIENAVEKDVDYDCGCEDTESEACHVVVRNLRAGHVYCSPAQYGVSRVDLLNMKPEYCHFEFTAKEATTQKYSHPGYSLTLGSYLHSQNPDIPADDWVGCIPPPCPGLGYKNREEQIHAALRRALNGYSPMDAKNVSVQVSVTADFPKPGVQFKDLSAIMATASGFEKLVKLTSEAVKYNGIYFDNKFSKVVGLDARGFIWGTALAAKCRAGFVMARKKGKLPGANLVAVDYTTEYSSETLEMHPDAIQAGDRVVVCDDLVATGGSLKAACELVARAGGKVSACVVMLAVTPLLEGARALLGDIPLIVVLPDPNQGYLCR